MRGDYIVKYKLSSSQEKHGVLFGRPATPPRLVSKTSNALRQTRTPLRSESQTSGASGASLCWAAFWTERNGESKNTESFPLSLPILQPFFVNSVMSRIRISRSLAAVSVQICFMSPVDVVS